MHFTTFEDVLHSQDFLGFLSQHSLSLPNKLNIRGSSCRLVDLNTKSDSCMATFYDESRARDNNPFVRIHWFNGSSENVFYKIRGANHELTEEEKRKIQAKRIEHEERLKHEEQAMAELCYKEYSECGDLFEQHPYLNKKCVVAHNGLLCSNKTIYASDNSVRIKKGDLLIPILSLDNRFRSYQRIDAVGNKLMASGGRKSKCVFPIGKWNKNTKEVILCEGYATGATLHAATGKTVLVCFDINNIASVVTEIITSYKSVRIILACDFDIKHKSQIGIYRGLSLSQQYNLEFVYPIAIRDGSDWNDYQHETNLEQVKRLFFKGLHQFKLGSLEQVIQGHFRYLNSEVISKITQ